MNKKAVNVRLGQDDIKKLALIQIKLPSVSVSAIMRVALNEYYLNVVKGSKNNE
jgi:hypothetical protein